MKNLKCLFLCLLLSSYYYSQSSATYIKGNIVLLNYGVLNLGIEKEINKKMTYEVDLLYSPWKEIQDNHFNFLIATIEGRYYLKESFNGWYLGGNVGGSTYNITKWNYWNTGEYQKGLSYMVGINLGYVIQWNERWNLDLHLGGGTTQSFYKGYIEDKITNETIRIDGSKRYNKSGEIIPYKFGIMIGYKL